MKRPIISVTIFFILGIILTEKLNINFFLVCAIGLVLLLFMKKRWQMIILFAFLSAMLLTDYQNNKISNINVAEISGNYIIESATDEEYGKSYIAKNASENIYKTKIRIFGNTEYRPGDVVEIKGKVSLPEENSNPGLFNYKNYLKSNKIYALLDADHYDTVKIGETNNIFLKFKHSILDAANQLLDNNFEKDHSNFLKTVFLGEDRIEETEKEQIRELGIAHLLAISGFHISLLYSFIQFLLIKANIPRNTSMIVIIVGLWFYAYLLSWIPSVFRAVFMITAILISSRYYLPWDRMNILFLSLLINLLRNPFAIYDIGLQFSYLAAYIIIAVIPRFRLQEEKGLVSLIKFSAIVYIFLLPVQLYYFNEIQLGFLLGNIIIVPVFVLAILSAAIYILFGFIPLVGAGLLYFTKWSLNLLDWTIEGASLFASSITIPSFSLMGILCFYFLCFLYFYHRRALLQYKRFLFLSLFIILFCDTFSYYLLKPVTVTMIDIGQGDSILIKTREDILLVDTGGSFWENDSSGEYILKPALLKKGIRSLDYVLLSHFDEDHAGNIEIIMREFKPKAVIGRKNGKEILKEKYNINVPYVELENSILDFNSFQIFNYSAKDVRDENNSSLVFKMKAHNSTILFAGDIEKEAEEKYLDYDIESDILKVPHHGSKTSSTENFLDRVNPKLGIVSVGRNNMYGFPHEEVLQRYNKKGIPLLRTDEQGEIEIIIHRFGLKADTYWPKEFDKNIIFSILLWTIVFYILVISERTRDELHRWSKTD